MRWIFPLLAMAGCLAAAEADLDSARVTISYPELRALIEAARKEPLSPPPVPAAILSAQYNLAVKDSSLTGTATFVIQTFTEGPHLLPLIGDGAKIVGVEPSESLMLLREGSYMLSVEGKSRTKVVLQIVVPLRVEGAGLSASLAVSPCPLSSLLIRNIPEGEVAKIDGVESGVPDPGNAVWQLGATDFLRLSFQKEEKEKPVVVALTGSRVEMPAIVRSATSDMRVVRDGSYINTTAWTVRHDGVLNWTLAMPADSQLITCRVAGENVSPILQDARTWVVPLPAPKGRDETAVELVYSGREAAFEPVRGEFTGVMPGTDLLVEKLEWQLRIPRPYETVAIQGNVDFMPSPSADELRLIRELGRGEAATVHVFYQKPEITKK